jgi:hypothetical protein
LRHVRIAGRVIFTSEGHSPLGNAKRLHRLRRSFCKSWRNDKWRDLLLAFWFWFSSGETFVDVPMGEGAAMRLVLPPLTFEAPFGIDMPDETAPLPNENAEAAEEAESEADDEGSDDEPEDLDDDE